MCQSQAEGGRRCAPHLRAELARALQQHATNPTPESTQRLADARALYAATRAGRTDLKTQARAAAALSPERFDLEVALRDGQRIAQARERDRLLRRNPAALGEARTAQRSFDDYRAYVARAINPTGEVNADGTEQVDVAAVQDLARHPNVNVRAALAAHPGLTGLELDGLIRDPDYRVRRAAALYARTPGVLRRLAFDPDHRVRLAALTQPPRQPDAKQFNRHHVEAYLAELAESDPNGRVRDRARAVLASVAAGEALRRAAPPPDIDAMVRWFDRNFPRDG